VVLLGDADTCPDIEYATGFRAVDPVVFLRKGSRRCLVVPQLEFGRAERTAPGVAVFSPEKLGLSGARRGRLSDWTHELLKHERVRSILVPGMFPHGVAVRLQRKGVRVTVAKTPLFPERAVKRPEEVRRIKEAQQAAVIAMRAAIHRIAETRIDANGYLILKGRKVTAEDVQRVITRVLVEHDCLSKDTIVAGGMQAVDPHETGAGPLKAREAIVIDIFPKHLHHGYWGDLTRTVVRGSAPASLRTMYQAVKAAQTAALNRVRAGTRADGVHRAAVAEFEKRGFKTEIVEGKGSGFVHSTGHGVGLAIHEAPPVGMAKERLKAGNVITIEPGLYYPGIGGIRIEDTVVVTPNGWRYLVPCEKKFEV
jgi:Xaa-Pro aminopeptidase